MRSTRGKGRKGAGVPKRAAVPKQSGNATKAGASSSGGGASSKRPVLSILTSNAGVDKGSRTEKDVGGVTAANRASFVDEDDSDDDHDSEEDGRDGENRFGGFGGEDVDDYDVAQDGKDDEDTSDDDDDDDNEEEAEDDDEDVVEPGAVPAGLAGKKVPSGREVRPVVGKVAVVSSERGGRLSDITDPRSSTQGSVSRASEGLPALGGQARMDATYMKGHIKAIVNTKVFPRRKFVDQDFPEVAQDMQKWFRELTRNHLPWGKEAFGYMRAALSDRRSNVSNQMKEAFLSK